MQSYFQLVTQFPKEQCNVPQNTRLTTGLETYRFTMHNTTTEDKLTNTFVNGDKMTGDAPTARTGLALCHRVILDSVAHWWVPGKDTHGTPVPLRMEAVGGPRHVPRDTTKTTRPRFTAPRLGYQHGSGAGLLKPQINGAATELGDKNSSRVHHRSRKDQTGSFHPDSEVEDCRGTGSSI